jgi:hypothetical protein
MTGLIMYFPVDVPLATQRAIAISTQELAMLSLNKGAAAAVEAPLGPAVRTDNRLGIFGVGSPSFWLACVE